MTGRHESLVLLAILAGRWDEVDELLRNAAVDAPVFLDLAWQCDVAPALHAALVASGRIDAVGPEVARGLADERTKTRHENVLLLSRLETALDVLAAAGIRPVALKGIDTLHRFYGSFDERNLNDVDLLVTPEERDAAIAALEAAGWSSPAEPARTHWFRSSYQLPMTSPGPLGVPFEIHWSLGQERRYAIAAGDLVARARPTVIAGRPLLRLDDHDAVAHLLLHHVQHYFDRRLKWVVEMGRLSASPAFDWGIVRERLSEWGGRGAAGLALVHVRKLFPEMLPDAAYDALPVDSWRLVATLPLRSAHPLDLFRGTRRRPVQLWIAAAALERPAGLIGYLRHRATRDRRP